MANILLGVTGSIAAYKAVDLTSKLTQAGHNVRVVLTESALEFITPLAFTAIGRNHVYTNTFKEEDPSVISHIHLGEWADVVVVAPVTANTLGKLANGIYDNMLLNVLAANTKPVIMAPAMNVNMYEQQAVKRNIDTLKEEGIYFLDSTSGFLACGYNAKGRMEEPINIMHAINELLDSKKEATLTKLNGKKVLITAGPTRENIDPVRYITNYSSGKMGYSIAIAARDLGAEVTLISGPVNIEAPKNVNIINVNTTHQMYEAVNQHMDAHIGIFTAAVSDYKPIQTSASKIKKSSEATMVLELTETEDILKYVGHQDNNMYVVGFAAETDDLEQNALKKLEKKNADCIILNDVSSSEIGMNSNYNQVSLFFKDGYRLNLPKREKALLARDIMNELIKRCE